MLYNIHYFIKPQPTYVRYDFYDGAWLTLMLVPVIHRGYGALCNFNTKYPYISHIYANRLEKTINSIDDELFHTLWWLQLK